MRAVMLVGPPNSMKLRYARHLAASLPETSDSVRIESAWMYQSGLYQDPPARPFRAPHHTVSEAGMRGGVDRVMRYDAHCRSLPCSMRVRPGEVSLAHGGCLVMDELHEFRRSVVESVGYVLRKGHSAFIVDGANVALPARPALLVATMNLCPCGLSPDFCKCLGKQITGWAARIAELSETLGITELISLDPVTVAQMMMKGGSL